MNFSMTIILRWVLFDVNPNSSTFTYHHNGRQITLKVALWLNHDLVLDNEFVVQQSKQNFEELTSIITPPSMVVAVHVQLLLLYLFVVHSSNYMRSKLVAMIAVGQSVYYFTPIST